MDRPIAGSALPLVIALGMAAHVHADGLHATDPRARVNVIVYVEAWHDLRDGVGASMRFITRSASDRFVRIQLNADYNAHTLVALLGHQLQHVVEVADHAEVQSSDDLRNFYRRTGVRTGPDSFDSDAARHAGYLVRDEIVSKPGDLRVARAASLAETRLLDGSSFTADDHTDPGSH